MLSTSELLSVQKPAQYLGGERGSVIKSDSAVDVNVCLAFPDTYEVGMSHVGIQILYDVLNRMPAVWAERAYQPLPDMEALLRKKKLPLSSLEAKRPLSQFDIIGFSLQYELCMNGILSMLDLGGVPLLAKDRNTHHPLVIGGGPVAYHPEPFADFFDAFLVGDGEESVPEFIEQFRLLSKSNLTRLEMLRSLSRLEGVYVPSFFEPQFSAQGRFLSMRPLFEDYTEIRRRIIPTLENAPYPENPVIPNIRAIHDRLSVEVMRGCVRGCRFCQAGYLYRPQRERSPEEIVKIVGNSLKNTGYEEISLLSLSTADYCSILPLLSTLKDNFAKNDELAISFPSTRVDALTPELLSEVQQIRRSGFTMAPEAGTQRLRDVINKGVTDDEIINTCRNVFKLGWNSVKLYFMIGLPTETDEDIQGIIDLGIRIKRLAGRGNDVTVSVSTLVPKPHTPFQWARQISEQETVQKQEMLLRGLKRTGVNLRYHDPFSTFLEGVFARGDRRLGQVILRAYEQGCRLDGWVENIKKEGWLSAFSATDIDPHDYLRARGELESLPWDHISCDIPKRYFIKEWQRAQTVRTTPDCLTQSCSTCGACDYDAVRNVLFDRKSTQSRLKIINPPWEASIEKRQSSEGINDEVKVGAAPHNEASMPSPASAAPGAASGYTLREYLKTENDTSDNNAKILATPERERLRLQYAKEGLARYSSHLELASIFFRAARRAGIPIAYSKGFHPKPRLCFGPPLQLGVASTCEFVDIYLAETADPQRIALDFNAALPEGLKVVSVTRVPPKTPSLQESIKEQTFSLLIGTADKNGGADEFKQRVTAWRNIGLERVRKGKSSTVQLSEFVSAVNLSAAALSVTLRNLPSGTLKPLEVFGALTGFGALEMDIKKTAVIASLP